MIYQVTYHDAHGVPLMQATFSAAGPKEALEVMLSVPSLKPPPATESFSVITIPPEET